MTEPIGCSRCGGFDPACPRCAARRLALEQADALDAAGPRTPHRDRLFESWLDETEQDDPAGGVDRWSVEGDEGVLAGLPKARP